MKKFYCLELSKEIYSEIKELKFEYHIKGQILRSCSSISLNLAEGAAKRTKKEKTRFYRIAYASLFPI